MDGIGVGMIVLDALALDTIDLGEVGLDRIDLGTTGPGIGPDKTDPDAIDLVAAVLRRVVLAERTNGCAGHFPDGRTPCLA